MPHDYDAEFSDPEQPGRDFSDLDEYLADYVDGTMDPDVQAVFEELLFTQPEIADHVEYLKLVRSQLCKLGDQCSCVAPIGFEARLNREIECEMIQERPPVLSNLVSPLHTLAMAAGLLLITLAVASALEPDVQAAPAGEAQASTERLGPPLPPLPATSYTLATATSGLTTARLTPAPERAPFELLHSSMTRSLATDSLRGASLNSFVQP
ncbi:MAG: hypothetical protein AAF752_09605 [Bacteroidota bacterium]